MTLNKEVQIILQITRTTLILAIFNKHFPTADVASKVVYNDLNTYKISIPAHN